MASEVKTFMFDDVSKHDKTEDCWVIISGKGSKGSVNLEHSMSLEFPLLKVYDVTPFMDEHPGGSEVMLAATRKDATEDFEDTGHSDEAKEMMGKYYVGKIDQSTVPGKRSYNLSTTDKKHSSSSLEPTQELVLKILKFLVPLILLGVIFVFRG